MAKLIDTPAGPLLCSRVNAGSLEDGDLVVTEHGHAVWRISAPRRGRHRSRPDDGLHVYFKAEGHLPTYRMHVNDPVWRAVGARVAGIMC